MDVSCASSSSDLHIPSSEDDSDDYSFSSEECGAILWRKFEGLPEIPGLYRNVAAIFRHNFGVESSNTLVQDSAKEAEKLLAMEVCKYLSQNGVEKIQVFSNFAKHATSVEKEIFPERFWSSGKRVAIWKPYQRYDYTDVTILILLECRGWKQQKLMFELVRKSYYESRLGVVIIGSSALLEDDLVDAQWKEYVDHLRNEDGIRDHLELYCKKHDLLQTDIYNGRDLEMKSNCGGCGKACGELSCGHVCPFLCHTIDATHKSEMFRCKEKCGRRCPYGHKCTRLCSDKCGSCFEIIKIVEPCEHVGQQQIVFCQEQLLADLCLIPVKKKLRCGHFGKMGCSTKETDYQCQKMVRGFHKCGHRFMYRCCEKGADFKCEVPSLITFNCGHAAFLPCHEGRPRIGLGCGEMCKEKLECGHDCRRPCHFKDPQHDKIKCVELCNRQCSRRTHPCGEQGHACSEPCPPCMEDYQYPLECGHVYKMRCSDKEPDESTYFCDQLCLRQYAFCRHECRKLCGEDCGVCNTAVYKVAPYCPRRHIVQIRCQERVPARCEFRMAPKIKSDCGHELLVFCYEADALDNMEVAARCEAWCGARLDKEKECGHLCRGTCKDCFQGRYHVRCEQSCGKILICGHTCTSPCGMVCPPCRYPCMNFCEHGRCELECGVPCEWKCKEPCPYMCEHSKCSKRCSEVCDKKICDEPCKKMLKCGHTCVGFCGEECPPYCRFCTPKELLRGIFSGNKQVQPSDRFIYLKDCGHCIESVALDCWLSSEYLVELDEIRPKICPVCRSRITWLRRYSDLFKKNVDLINSVRVKIFGKIEDIEDTINVTNGMVEGFEMAFVFPEFVDYIIGTADVPIYAASKLEAGLQSMSLDKAKFLKMICQEWMSVSRTVWEYHEKLLPHHYDLFIKYWQEYVYDMIAERPWPLHPNEIGQLKVERERLDDVLKLYSRVATDQMEEIKWRNSSIVGSLLFQEGEAILQLCKPYSVEIKLKFHQLLGELDAVLQCTIQLSETERVEIVQAFGEGSGRWFKCEKGHVYVVTECGGAMERGRCNECGGSIGGEDHVIAEQNYLASEMDGAELPLYPNVLARGIED